MYIVLLAQLYKLNFIIIRNLEKNQVGKLRFQLGQLCIGSKYSLAIIF